MKDFKFMRGYDTRVSNLLEFFNNLNSYEYHIITVTILNTEAITYVIRTIFNLSSTRVVLDGIVNRVIFEEGEYTPNIGELILIRLRLMFGEYSNIQIIGRNLVM